MKNSTTRFANQDRGLRGRRVVGMLRGSLLAALLTAAGPAQLHAAGLIASDGMTDDYFGNSVSFSGGSGLIAARRDDIAAIDQGSAYLFRNLDTATGTITQHVKLIASDGAANDHFGGSVSLWGDTGLVGISSKNVQFVNRGTAYLYRNLNTASGTITENVKLLASDGQQNDMFGGSVSLSGSNALVGAIGKNLWRGSAYLYRNLDTATGTIVENAKLVASDSGTSDYFGSVSLSGNMGLVGALEDDIGSNLEQGSAYLFRNLDTATGTITENAKLIASDGAAQDAFGGSVSLSGNNALLGARLDNIGANNDQGSAYFFQNLNTATGTITQNVKLIASDGAADDYFGNSVSLSGNTALIGAVFDNAETSFGQGSAYLYRNLDTATGTVIQNLKILASDASTNSYLGGSVSLDGDYFIIGAARKNSYTGKAYTGSVSSLTTLDAGSTSKTISQISFISQDDWIIGQTTDANQVTLSAGDAATVNASGKKVFIGQNAGSDNNRLIIAGTLTATQINVGAVGNSGNILQIGTGGSTGTLSAGSVITNHGSVVFNRSVATTQGMDFGTAAITGSGSVTQTGTGTTTFRAANTYSGDTIIKAGTLKLDLAGGMPNSARIIVGDAGSSGAKLDVSSKTGGFTVGAAQTLLGIGRIDGNTQILGTHAPGNSPGLQTMNGNLTYGSGAQLDWELAVNASSYPLGLRGTNFDGVNVIGAGVLSIQPDVTSNLIFNTAGSTVDWNNPFWDSNQTWLVYINFNAPALSTDSIFETIHVSADSLGNALTPGTFSWRAYGSNIYLDYAVIPEPSTWFLGALSLLGLSLAARRKKTKRGAAM